MLYSNLEKVFELWTVKVLYKLTDNLTKYFNMD